MVLYIRVVLTVVNSSTMTTIFFCFGHAAPNLVAVLSKLILDHHLSLSSLRTALGLWCGEKGFSVIDDRHSDLIRLPATPCPLHAPAA
jgi:hypothetical protein